MSSVFDEKILADKLSKLNSSQQCIETLSHWCIFHRSKADVVAATWDKQFHNSEMAQKVHLLYLANDILQNSKKNGNEFVTEFWKVLPAALKDVNEKGESHGKSVVSRLVNIWEERRVFGSRARNLSELMLGEQLPPELDFSKKRSRYVKIMKRDSHSIKTKLTIGGAPEKIVSAFTLVLGDHRNEEQEMSRCKFASQQVRRLEEEVDLACRKAKDPKRKTLSKELEEEEKVLRESIENLKAVEANRQALVSQLQEALHEQESELESVRTQMQVGLAQAEEASGMRKRLDDENYVGVKRQLPTDLSSKDVKANGGPPSKKSAAAIAAEVADRLAASTSSQYIMSSVLSTFAAEEAKSAGLNKSSSTPSSLPLTSLSPMAAPPPPVAAPPSNNYQSMTLMPQVAIQTQTPSSQAQFHMVYPSTSLQYLQPSGGIVNSYAYASMPSLPPARPPTQPQSQMVMPWTQQQMHMAQQVPPPPLPVAQQHQMQMTQQPPAPPSFRPVGLMPPPGGVYYGYPNQSQ